MEKIAEVSHNWKDKLVRTLTRSPSKINPTVKKFVADKEREKRASQINKTMGGGSVPHVAAKPSNPWHIQHQQNHNDKAQGFKLVGKPHVDPHASTTKHQFKNEDVNEVATQHGWHFVAKKILKHKKLLPKVENITNPWAIAWWEKNQGYTSHK